MVFDPEKMAYCGLYCPQCSFQCAWETGDRAHVEAMPEKYDRLKGEALEEYRCAGCKQDDFCGPCAMKDCAGEKGYVSCADCGGFPCAHVLAFESDGVPHHRAGVGHLRMIREKGYADWFAAFSPALACACGKRQSWYLPCGDHEVV